MVNSALWISSTFIMSFISSAAFADCDVQLKLLTMSHEQCKQDARYCGDIPLYRVEAVAQCGKYRVAELEHGGNQSANDGDNSEGGVSAMNGEIPGPNDAPPPSCAYFTKPAYEAVRMNYHQEGTWACWTGKVYECQGRSNGTRAWTVKGRCEQLSWIEKACKMEGTC